MRQLISLTMILLLTVTYRGCSPEPKSLDENPAFSYDEEIAMYLEDSPNVKRDGFVNTTELEKVIDTDHEAVDQAMKEYTLDNSSPYYSTFFDPEASVWKVVFNYHDPDQDKQSVYLNEKGKTLLIVYTPKEYDGADNAA